MDCSKVGDLLYRLRREKNLTQKQVADRLNISDKTVSKWERGLGCPDVSLLGELSGLFEVNTEKILAGDLEANGIETGNLRHIKFFVCPTCANVISTTGNAEVSCCGRKLAPLRAMPADDEHAVTVEDSDDAFYVTFAHEMTKQHYLTFVAFVVNDKMFFVKLYPEQEASVILPKTVTGKRLNQYGRTFYFCCSRHGLYTLPSPAVFAEKR